MGANVNASYGNITQDFTRLFNATTRAFERDAQRMTIQIQMATPVSSAKRSSRK